MLRLSTKARYATRIAVRLALAVEGDNAVSRRQIAAAEDISMDYLEQILIQLKAAGLVVSRRGIHGGYRLARAPTSISVMDVVEATDGAVAMCPCLERACERRERCTTYELWRRANESLCAEFSRTDIAALAAGADDGANAGQNYVI